MIVVVLAAGCATGGDGDTPWGDDGGGGPVVDASADEQTDAVSEGAPHEAGGRGAPDAAAAQDGGTDASPDVAGSDSSQDAGQDASPGTDAPLDDASDDASEGDGETDGGSTMEGGGGCNAQNCNGCCNGTHCVSGTSNHACGSAGGACQDCSALGDTCVSGACQGSTGTCSKSCAGCCDKSDACHAQASPQYCPTNNGNLFQPGGPCEDCTAEGDTQCFLDLIAYVCLP